MAEHHVKQIYTGLFGWFDEDESRLFPLPAMERANRLIEGFGGIEKVRGQVDAALEGNDYRWAAEMAGWLVRCMPAADGRADGGEQEDRHRLAESLRGFGHATRSANVRNWCMTRALELDGEIDLGRFRGHRFRRAELESRPIAESVSLLRVLLDPIKAEGRDDELQIQFGDASAGLRIRNCVSVTTDGSGASCYLQISEADWIQVLTGKTTIGKVLDEGTATSDNPDRVQSILGCFDLASLNP